MIKLRIPIKSSNHSPDVEKRGLKFNIPLDARTPSYADFGDAAQKNIATMWEMDYWKQFIDELARYRYNTISLWKGLMVNMELPMRMINNRRKRIKTENFGVSPRINNLGR